MPARQDQIDRAHEWTREHYPEADGDDYEARFGDALEDIVRIDRDADRAEGFS